MLKRIIYILAFLTLCLLAALLCAEDAPGADIAVGAALGVIFIASLAELVRRKGSQPYKNRSSASVDTDAFGKVSALSIKVRNAGPRTLEISGAGFVETRIETVRKGGKSQTTISKHFIPSARTRTLNSLPIFLERGLETELRFSPEELGALNAGVSGLYFDAVLPPKPRNICERICRVFAREEEKRGRFKHVEVPCRKLKSSKLKKAERGFYFFFIFVLLLFAVILSCALWLKMI